MSGTGKPAPSLPLSADTARLIGAAQAALDAATTLVGPEAATDALAMAMTLGRRQYKNSFARNNNKER